MISKESNAELTVQESGPAEAPSIVFLHGGGGGGWMWQPQVEALQEYHCLVPDLPEHGRSMEVKPFTIRDSAERIARLIRSRAHGGRAHVVGLSEGAQVGLTLLGLAPEVVDRTVLSSALVRPLPGASLYSPGLIAASYRWFMQPLKKNDFWIRTNMKWAAGVPEKYYPAFKEDFQRTTQDSFVHVMVENMSFRLPPGLERVTAPTLVVVGQKEYAAMRQSAQEIAAALPNGQAYQVVHPKGLIRAQEHNWNMVAPELFTAMVRAWIEGKPLPEALKPI